MLQRIYPPVGFLLFVMGLFVGSPLAAQTFYQWGYDAGITVTPDDGWSWEVVPYGSQTSVTLAGSSSYLKIGKAGDHYSSFTLRHTPLKNITSVEIKGDRATKATATKVALRVGETLVDEQKFSANSTFSVAGLTGELSICFTSNLSKPASGTSYYLELYSITVTSGGAAESRTLAISESGYATIYEEEPWTMPEGVTGGVVKESIESLNAGESPTYRLVYDWCYPAGSTVPAQSALVVKAAEGEALPREYLYYPTSTAAVAVADNMLHGAATESQTMVEGDDGTGYYYYKLSYGEGETNELGFWWGAADGGPFVCSAGKAYLALPRSHTYAGEQKGFELPQWDEATGLPDLRREPASVDVRAIDGRLLRRAVRRDEALKSLPSGIYLVGKRKVWLP